jgi:hypothetical protein
LAGLIFAVLLADVGPAAAQVNFDRPGNDYTRIAIPSGDPADCALTCERDRKCKAWSFSYPTANSHGAVCRLKSTVPPRTESACCVSGVRGAGVVEPRNSRLENATDRLGGDYRNLAVSPDLHGDACKAACEADHKCRAWTYARPGYIGKDARCYLKDKIKPPRRKPGFISGVVR